VSECSIARRDPGSPDETHEQALVRGLVEEVGLGEPFDVGV